jgi:hypothetical protein
MTFSSSSSSHFVALREQHPEWIEQNGDCPACESYESRFAERLNVFLSTATNSQVPSKGHRFLINGERYDGKLDLEHWLVALSAEEKSGSVLRHAEEKMKRARTTGD